MTIYQAKIAYIEPGSAPDEYDPTSGITPPPAFVTARDKNGRVLSRYGDLSWDRTPYDRKKRPYAINFNPWSEDFISEGREKLIAEMKWLMFILIYLNPKSSSNGTLHNYAGRIRSLALIAEKHSCSIEQVLSHHDLVIKSMPGSQLKTVRSLIRLIKELGPKLTGLQLDQIPLSEELQAAIDAYRDSVKQTTPIPTRIYSSLLASLSNELEQYSLALERILTLTEEFLSDPLMGKGQEYQDKKRNELGLVFDYWRPTFDELLEKHNLKSFWETKNIRTDGNGLAMVLLEIQCLASLQIQAFTGMRGEETDLLHYDCLKEEKRYGDNRAHYIIYGMSTKSKKGQSSKAKWVTSISGRKAVEIAQKLVSFIYDTLDNKTGKKTAEVERHLFLTPSCLFRDGQRPVILKLKLGAVPNLVRKINFPIREEDIKELELLDSHRHWRLEAEYEIGKPWPFKRHQLRRSLALYAHSSGLVSLPSLKRQLQHITQEMALYYCNGSAFAKDFIGNSAGNEHIGIEWRETAPVSRALGYITNVLLADQEDLFGTHVAWVQVHKKDDEGNILVDREATIAAVKKGQYSYTANVLGGCSSAVKCDKQPISIINVECMRDHCKHLVGSVKKVSRVIQIQEVQVGRLRSMDKASVECRIEEGILFSLKAGLEEGQRSIAKRNQKNG
jgi:hypothetical protein